MSLWSWLSALATGKRLVEEGGGKFDVLDRRVVFLNGRNRHQNRNVRSFRACRGRGAHSFFHLFRSPAWFPTQRALCDETQLSIIFTVFHSDCSSHPHTTAATTYLSCLNGRRHAPPTDPILLCFCFLSPSSPLVSLVDAQVFFSTSFSLPPPSPFYICYNSFCSSSVNLHCT